MHFKFVFVVLVYKNTDVLDLFFKSIKRLDSFKCVLVNAYYDDISEKECRNKAVIYDADYVNTPNVGYGEGNNIGISYAVSHYSFDYLIVSNSDIIVVDISMVDKLDLKHAIIAPQTRMLTGKFQNPLLVRENRLYYSLMRTGYLSNSFYLVRMGHFIARFERELFLFASRLISKNKWRVFGAHGSFFIMTSSAVRTLCPLFEKRMFLYNEELYLAYSCKNKSVPVYYAPALKVSHLEGASAGFNFREQFRQYQQSFLVLDEVLHERIEK